VPVRYIGFDVMTRLFLGAASASAGMPLDPTRFLPGVPAPE
jgi:hypothetical protein